MSNIPLVVLAAGKKAFYSQAAQLKWLQLQEKLLQLSTKNKFIIAEDSGHYIQKDEPHYILAENYRLKNRLALQTQVGFIYIRRFLS
jgi:hypothetical protein